MSHFSDTMYINTSQHSACCQPPLSLDLPTPKNSPKMDRILRVVEKISVVAIGVFSAMVSFPLFATSFALGLSIGLWEGRKFEHHSHKDHALCAHGFIEHLTGVKLPAPLSLAANVAILIAHIDHHATVFIPIIGISMGIRAASPLYNFCKNSG